MTTTKSGTEREVEGTAEKWKGKAKEVVGDVLDDPGLADSGRAQGAKGELRERAGKLQRQAEQLEAGEK